MAKQNKRDKRVIVNEMYFNGLVEKAAAFDSLTDHFDGVISVSVEDIKRSEKILNNWNKNDIFELSGSEPYVEPKS